MQSSSGSTSRLLLWLRSGRTNHPLRGEKRQTTAVMGSRPRGNEAQEAVGEAGWENDWMYLASLITRSYSSSGNSSPSVECLTGGSQRERTRRPDRRLGVGLEERSVETQRRESSPVFSYTFRSCALMAAALREPRIRVITALSPYLIKGGTGPRPGGPIFTSVKSCQLP